MNKKQEETTLDLSEDDRQIMAKIQEVFRDNEKAWRESDEEASSFRSMNGIEEKDVALCRRSFVCENDDTHVRLEIYYVVDPNTDKVLPHVADRDSEDNPLLVGSVGIVTTFHRVISSGGVFSQPSGLMIANRFDNKYFFVTEEATKEIMEILNNHRNLYTIYWKSGLGKGLRMKGEGRTMKEAIEFHDAVENVAMIHQGDTDTHFFVDGPGWVPRVPVASLNEWPTHRTDKGSRWMTDEDYEVTLTTRNGPNVTERVESGLTLHRAFKFVQPFDVSKAPHRHEYSRIHVRNTKTNVSVFEWKRGSGIVVMFDPDLLGF